MTETELDMASPGMQRENKSRKKSLANAELTIEVGFRVEKYDFPFFCLHRCVYVCLQQKIIRTVLFCLFVKSYPI